MKKTFPALAVFSLVVIVLTYFFLTPFPTVKKSKLQQPPSSPSHNTEQEAAIQADVAEDTAKPACKIIIQPLQEENAMLLHALEPEPTDAKDLALDSEQKPPSPLQTIAISSSIDIQPTMAHGDKAIRGLGLLTDTEETAENQILELQSMQVQPSAARIAKKHRKNIVLNKNR